MRVFNLCRICLLEGINTGDMQPLFEENDKRCAEIVQKIEECGGIVLKPHDEFPKMICGQCVETLNTSYKFRLMCQASEHTLLDSIVKSELKTEPQENTLSPLEESQCDVRNTVFFDMNSEFVAEEVDITELAKDPTFSDDCDLNSPICTLASASSSEEEEAIPRKTTRARKIKTALTPGKKRKRRTLAEIRADPKVKKTCAVGTGRGRKKLETPQENIICEICGNIYTKKSLLNMHMRRHMTEKPFACEICGKTFACPSEISRHIRVHTGEKPYVCKFCGRTFADRSTNIKHERIHTNERPFECKTCGKSFTYSNVLKNHMLTHTGEKPFTCVPCNKTFSRKHQLDQHLGTLTHQQTAANLGLGLPKEIETPAEESLQKTLSNVGDLINDKV